MRVIAVISLFMFSGCSSFDKMREQGFRLGFVRGVVYVPLIPMHHEPFSEDENGRAAYFIGQYGKIFEINVVSAKIIQEQCGNRDALGCVVPDGSKITSAWLVDSFAVALIQCARIFALDAGWTPETIAGELSDEKLGPYSLAGLQRTYGDKPANREPCGPSPYYTGMGWGDWTTAVRYGESSGGRLLTLDEWKRLMQKEDLDASAWR